MAVYIRLSKVQAWHEVDVIQKNFAKTKCRRTYNMEYVETRDDKPEERYCTQCIKPSGEV